VRGQPNQEVDNGSDELTDNENTMRYNITINDKAVPVLQLGMDAENKHRVETGQEPHATLDDFLSWVVVNYFGVSDDELEAQAKQAVVVDVHSKLDDMTKEEAAELAIAAGEIIGKRPGVEAPKDPVEPVAGGTP